MSIVLDDFCRFFDHPGEHFQSTLISIFENFKTFDEEEFKTFKHLMCEALQVMGEYEVISYVSGTEAVDRSILWALKEKSYKKVYKFKEVYHGSTLLLGERKAQSLPFELCLLNFSADPTILLSQLEQIQEGVLLIEPLFGDFFSVIDTNFFQKLQEICQSNNLCLFMDETRSGLFHYGSFSYSEKVQLAPEMICFAKGLGFGAPLSCVAYRKDFFEKMNFKEAKLLSTSQSTNTLSIKMATTLLNYFKSETFLNCLNETQSKLKNLCTFFKSLSLFDQINLEGQMIILSLSDCLKSLKNILTFFKFLTASGLKVRFPEKKKLILLFPFDFPEEKYTQIEKAFGEIDIKLNKQHVSPSS